MKKLFTVLSVLFVLGTANVFATGIGAQFGGLVSTGNGSPYVPGAAVTFKINKIPCVFAADFRFGNESFAAGLSADWWLANPKIEGTWGYYYGVGVGGSVAVANSNYAGFAIGPRALVGTNVFVLKKALEFYAQCAWQPMFTFTSNNGIVPDWDCFSPAVGFRFWF